MSYLKSLGLEALRKLEDILKEEEENKVAGSDAEVMKDHERWTLQNQEIEESYTSTPNSVSFPYRSDSLLDRLVFFSTPPAVAPGAARHLHH